MTDKLHLECYAEQREEIRHAIAVHGGRLHQDAFDKLFHRKDMGFLPIAGDAPILGGILGNPFDDWSKCST